MAKSQNEAAWNQFDPENSNHNSCNRLIAKIT